MFLAIWKLNFYENFYSFVRKDFGSPSEQAKKQQQSLGVS